jgi:hypothetical protein
MNIVEIGTSKVRIIDEEDPESSQRIHNSASVTARGDNSAEV